LPTRDDDDEDENEGNTPRANSNAPGTLTNKPTLSQIDLEWAQFERDVLAKPAQSALNPNETSLSKKEIYDRATVVMGEEVRYDMNGTDGFPDHLQSGTSAGNNTRTRAGAGIEGEYVGGAPLEDETPEQVVARKAQEEKELIMDRILDEERAQEDADEKVRAIKARLALVRKKREDEKRRKAAGGIS
jgi:zinc finger protein 830